jgi:hypothetical protein
VNDSQNPQNARRRFRRVAVALTIAAAFIGAFLIALQIAIRHAPEIVRARVVQSLSERFDSQVELRSFDVSVIHGLNVSGGGLVLRSNRDPDLPPQVMVEHFHFHTSVLDLLRKPMHVHRVELSGLTINIPPKNERHWPHSQKGHRAHLSIIVDTIQCDHALLTLLNGDPKKKPLIFTIHGLTLQRAGSHRPMLFHAVLINPRPLGDIETSGHFGPWHARHPSLTPLDGTYSFRNADLSTTKGIAGMLSSEGRFKGELDSLTVDGHTDTPDFSVDVSGQKVALHTDFHAIVNGTNGNTYLQPVRASFLKTRLTATGYVVRGADGKGHHISLNVVIHHGRIEDLLRLGAKTNPPVMTGPVQLTTRFDLPPGPRTVIHRLSLQGNFAVDQASFTNPKWERGVEELSLRSRGKANAARMLAQSNLPAGATSNGPVPVSVHGRFTLANQTLTFSQLDCSVPGAAITLAGTYTLDGRDLDMTGKARMQAHLSHIVGGWKGKLLRPADPFFARHGAGTEVPIRISGTKTIPHIGLNY